MAVFTPEELLRAKEMDLLTYLRNYEPGELVHVSGETYCTREHDSLKISNGKWYWFSRGIGGKSALDYLIKVKGYSFVEAVSLVIGRSAVTPPVFQSKEVHIYKNLLIPELNDNCETAKKYLLQRGIHMDVIDYCIEHRLLVETTKFHNAVFIGYDVEGTPRYGNVRGTTGMFKGELSGSDKHYSFSLRGNSDTVHVFESAIDAMSYATILLLDGRDWHEDHLLSLAGVYKTKRSNVVPVALEQFLKDGPQIKTLRLHLDNDEIGRGAVAGIVSGLQDKYRVYDEPPRYGKDVNDQLKYRVGILRGGDWER